MIHRILQRMIYICVGMVWGSVAVFAVGLTNSTPQPNQTLQAGTQNISLKFDQTFDPFRVRVLLLDKGKEPVLIPATASLEHKQVTGNYVLKAGDYTLEWHVWTWDNKESSGNIPFHVVGVSNDAPVATIPTMPVTQNQPNNNINK